MEHPFVPTLWGVRICTDNWLTEPEHLEVFKDLQHAIDSFNDMVDTGYDACRYADGTESIERLYAYKDEAQIRLWGHDPRYTDSEGTHLPRMPDYVVQRVTTAVRIG